MTECAAAAAVHGFLMRFLEDQERGRVDTLTHYQALSPAHAVQIARKYAEVLAPDSANEGPRFDHAAARPTHLGRFALLGELGRGGQGTVYLAHDPRLGRRVALKMLAPRFRADPGALARFRREAETISRLAHPGLASVHEVGEAEGLPFFVMHFVEGRSLAARLAVAERPPRDTPEVFAVLALVARAARALHVAHEAGVVHRDLKPGNLMVTPEGEPVVLDFGLAYDEERSVSLTLSGDVFGTPAYMAPEQLDDSKRADRRTDVYALGVVLYECLTLQRPFSRPTRAELYRAILSEEPRAPELLDRSLSRDVVAILASALAKEPENRYPSAAALADDLERAARHEPVRARPAGPLLRLRRWVRRDPALAGTAAGLFVTLAGGLALTSAMAARAADSLTEEQRLGDQRAAVYLLRTVERLWPVLPENVARMDAWLAEVDGLLERRHVPAEELERLVTTRARVGAHREDAATLVARTIDAHRSAWDALREELARDARYGGLGLVPQAGLVPLGRDPHSGLFEFAHLQTGVPAEHEVSGQLVVGDETGLVFVLVPGGSFVMGCGGENCHFSTVPEHEVALAPYFLSKYEMTQGQWWRLTGSNPSGFALEHGRDPATSLHHPVENVSWDDCVEVLATWGLMLPSEAQWECAARGGTCTQYWSGEELTSLSGAANLADSSAIRAGMDYSAGREVPFDDGFALLAPVGSFRANAFGLHDMSGNVWEFASDVYGSYEHPVRAGSGERVLAETGTRVLRGGSYVDGDNYAPVHVRYPITPSARFWSQGLRPARAIQGTSSASPP